MMKHIFVLSCIMLLSACAGGFNWGGNKAPSSIGEKNSGYSYVPLDPMKVKVTPKSTGTCTITDYLNAFPDNAVRLAIGKINGDGSLSFGPLQTGYRGNSYKVVMDYTNIDTAHVDFVVYKKEKNGTKEVSAFSDMTEDHHILATRIPENTAFKEDVIGANDERTPFKVSVPVYVGVGLRLTARITVESGEVNLSSLGALAASVKAGKSNGSMVLQTMGLTGPKVIPLLPIPSDLNETTVQNALVTMGSVKAVMGSKEGVLVTPRVVGISNPVGAGGPELTHQIVAELARTPVPWELQCKVDSKLTD
jgi:hypothetical protein